MEIQFYLYLSSEDSKTYFPGNDEETFTVNLSEILQLKGSRGSVLVRYRSSQGQEKNTEDSCLYRYLCGINLWGKTSPPVKGYYRKIINLFLTAVVYTSENTRSEA